MSGKYYIQFSSEVVDDYEISELKPRGKTTLVAIVNELSSDRFPSTEIEQLSHYGWDVEFRTKDTTIYCFLQCWDKNEYLLGFEEKKGIFGFLKVSNENSREFAKTIQFSICRNENFHDVSDVLLESELEILNLSDAKEYWITPTISKNEFIDHLNHCFPESAIETTDTEFATEINIILEDGRDIQMSFEEVFPSSGPCKAEVSAVCIYRNEEQNVKGFFETFLNRSREHLEIRER